MIYMRKKYREDLKMLMLYILKDSEHHAYGILSELEKIIGFRPPPSIIYPLFKTLHREGLVVYVEGLRGGRHVKIYRLTDRGREFIERNRERLEEVMRHVERHKKMEELGVRRIFNVIKRLHDEIDRLDQKKQRDLKELFIKFEREVINILSGAEKNE